MNFNPNEDTEIDAEFMEKWLGGVEIDSLSPKTLFDLQTLMSHYKDIIVPMDNVKISFPVEGFDTACASVDEKKVFIPTQVLQEGRVDDTIGLVIHELNHIKHSERESVLIKACSNFLMVCLDSIFVKVPDSIPKITHNDEEYLSLKEIVYRGGFDFNNLLKSEPKTGTEQFFLQCLKGVMLLLNSVEDVRIDSICPPNLKKYIDKLDIYGFGEFKEHYESGMLDEDTLMNIVFRLLFHHKGFVHDVSVDNRFGDIKFIKNSTPKQYIPILLKEFRNEIKQYCEEVFNSSDIDTPTMGNKTNDYLQMMEESSNEESFDKTLAEDKSFSEDCVRDVEFEDSELNPNRKRDIEKTQYEIKIEEGSTLLEVPSYLKASIDAFKDVDVVDCSEQFTTRHGDIIVANYKTLLIG